MVDNRLAHEFAAYAGWRKTLGDAIGDFRNWLDAQEHNDSQTVQRINHLLERLRYDKLNVAFVAEFSRGKSELISIRRRSPSASAPKGAVQHHAQHDRLRKDDTDFAIL